MTGTPRTFWPVAVDVALTGGGEFPLLSVLTHVSDHTDSTPVTGKGRVNVGLVGELDLATAGVVAVMVEQQIAARQLEVCIDLSELMFCDVRGLRALVQAHRELATAGGRLTLSNPRPLLMRTARLVGVAVELGWHS